MNHLDSYRILVVDDQEAIHQDFAKILGAASESVDLAAAGAALFGGGGEADGAVKATAVRPRFRLDFASQGEQALALLRRAKADQDPYAVAFVDMRMPPGWDGLRTIEELWREAEDLHAVICTAYSDHALSDVSARLGSPDRLLILKKPFDAVEVEQAALSLCEKWRIAAELRRHIEELTKARSAAEAAGEAKAQFLANMSHEIRTPLTAILGYVDILREEDLPRHDQLEYLETIRQSGDHLMNVVSDVLDIAKLEAERFEFERLPFAPVRLLRQAIAIMQVAAVEKGLELDLVLDGEWPEIVLGDTTRLQQILLNLVGNAIKFTDQGHVRVRAAMRRHAMAPVELSLSVEDTGIGIPPDSLKKLFTMFVQGDSTMARRFGGTGLGLVIARRLARAMGGDITVESEVGRGSCFRTVIPLAVPADAAWSAAGASAANTPLAALRTRPGDVTMTGRVLLVDDSRDNRMLFSRHLQRAGAAVTVAVDGREAMELWRTAQATDGPFDLIVTDVQMPDIDGYELTRTLRKQGCKVPILALTANALPSERQSALLAGCDEYLSKPVERQKLVRTCERLVAQRPRAM